VARRGYAPSSCFVIRWSASEIEIGPKGPYDQLFEKQLNSPLCCVDKDTA